MPSARFAAVPLVIALAACQQAAVETTIVDAEEAILAQERRALDQWSQGNPMGYLEVQAEDVTYFDDIAAATRVDGADEMRSYFMSLEGQIPPHRYEIVDPHVQVYGHVGVLTLHYQPYGPEDRPDQRWKATSVYRWTGDDWRIVHAHWSTVESQ